MHATKDQSQAYEDLDRMVDVPYALSGADERLRDSAEVQVVLHMEAHVADIEA